MPWVICVINVFLVLGPAHINAGREYGWLSSLTAFVWVTFDEVRTDFVLENGNLGVLFEALSLFRTEADAETVQAMPSLSPFVEVEIPHLPSPEILATSGRATSLSSFCYHHTDAARHPVESTT
jgi:hypothetical protein